MMGGASSPKLVATVILWAAILLFCSCWCNSAAESRREANIMEVGVPKCNLNKIKDGDYIAGAIAKLARKLLTASPKLINHPSRKRCFCATYNGVTAYGAVSCFNELFHCETCLDAAFTTLSEGCGASVGAQVTMHSCFMRFEAYTFC